MQSPDPHPFVVTVIPATPAKETTLSDVVVGAFGVTGVLVVLGMALGVVAAALRLGWNRRFPPANDHLPPVTPSVTEPTGPPSAPTR